MDAFINSLGGFFQTVWVAIKSILRALTTVILTPIFQFIPLTKAAHFVREKLPWLWNWAMARPWIKQAISFAVIRKFGNITAPRPHAHAMNHPYTNWEGLTDRTINKRHLAEAEIDGLPPIEDIEELFLRDADAGQQIDDERSNLLFASFAAWFTDSFLRTAHNIDFDGNDNAQLNDDDTIKRTEGREVRNESNHEIDLCQIYGMNSAKRDMLRHKTDDPDDMNRGCLAWQDGEDGEYPVSILSGTAEPGKELPLKPGFEKLHPEPLIRSIFSGVTDPEQQRSLWAVGLEHGNATIGNSLFNVIFLRQHNALAREMAAAHPEWDADEVFHKTRCSVMVMLLKIVASDYIRHISALDLPLGIYPGIGDGQAWYRPNRIHIEFNILYRWHALVPDTFPFLPAGDGPRDQFNAFRHNNVWLQSVGIAGAIDELAKVPAGKMVLKNTPRALQFATRDTLRMMRAAKLQNYNAYRKCFDLPPARNFEDVTGEKEMSAKLSALYGGDISKLEWYVGMVAEQHDHRAIMGDLLLHMVAHDAFTHAVTNPLLSEAVFKKETFGPEGWRMVNKTERLVDIVERVAPGAQHCQFAVV